MKALKRAMWIVSAVPFIVTAFLMKGLPDTVVLHYDSRWKADGWGSKYMNWLFPLLILAITGFWALMVRYYEKKAEEAAKKEWDKEVKDNLSNAKLLAIVGLCMAAGFSIMQAVILINQYSTAGDSSFMSGLSIGRISNIIIAVIIIIAANIMPRSRMNSTFGLRISWSMYNETTWSMSNRFAGRVLFVTGIIILIISLLAEPLTASIWMILLLLAACFISIWYAHKVYVIQKNLDGKK